jgi:hypothetical protein
VRRFVSSSVTVLALWVCLCAQLYAAKSADDASASRNLTGNVFDKAKHSVPNAIVYLKNTRSLAVLTFITGADGSYRFNNLSPNVDYEVRAEANGHKSPVKTLSAFDTHKHARINLKLNR